MVIPATRQAPTRTVVDGGRRIRRDRALWAGSWCKIAGPSSIPRFIYFTVLPPDGATLVPGQVPLISPDGQRIVLNVSEPSGRSALYLRALASSEVDIVLDTALAIWPFWSLDSQSIGFFADGKLYTIWLGDTTPRVITDGTVAAWWLRGAGMASIRFTKFNNDRIFRDSPLLVAQATAVTTTTAATTVHTGGRSFFPTGRDLLYYVPRSARPDVRGLYLAGLHGIWRRSGGNDQHRSLRSARISALSSVRFTRCAILRRHARRVVGNAGGRRRDS